MVMLFIVCIHIYIYLYFFIYVYIYIHTYIYIYMRIGFYTPTQLSQEVQHASQQKKNSTRSAPRLPPARRRQTNAGSTLDRSILLDPPTAALVPPKFEFSKLENGAGCPTGTQRGQRGGKRFRGRRGMKP